MLPIMKEEAGRDLRAEIQEAIEDFITNSPTARLSFLDDYPMWKRPIVGFVDGDDPIFEQYKEAIGPDHLTPREALAKVNQLPLDELPEQVSIVTWVLPITEETRKSNRKESRVPSRLWSHTRWHGEECNNALRRLIVELLRQKGYLAAAPVVEEFYELFSGPNGLYSNWSERHVSFAAGLGTFSLSDGFITEQGIAHRCGSVITSAPLASGDPQRAKHPFGNCLFYQGVHCRACILRCPVGAITVNGHDKEKCHEYFIEIGYLTEDGELKDSYDNETGVAGCGLCQTKVPCESVNPVKKRSPRDD